MKKAMVLMILGASFSCYALDFDKLIESAKSEVNSLLGKEEKKGVQYVIPDLPKIVKDAKSTDVYNKEGAVFETGKAFNDLPKNRKRKYQYIFLKEIISVVRGAEATDQELTNYLNVLDQGGNREGIYRSLVVGGDYKNLELYQQPISKTAVDFAHDFGERYLGVSYGKEDMQRLNIWTLKRVFVDRTLDLVDAFPKDGKDLYMWYGLMSFELASRYAVWTNSIRRSEDPETHIKWAKSVPFQHLKSEVIIKLHKIFNYLQEK